jgi:hypothetical protein
LIRDDWEIGRQSAVVVNQQDVFEVFCSIATNELGNDFTADRTPDVVNAITSADFFGVI